jgi:hypothetical protein
MTGKIDAAFASDTPLNDVTDLYTFPTITPGLGKHTDTKPRFHEDSAEHWSVRVYDCFTNEQGTGCKYPLELL